MKFSILIANYNNGHYFKDCYLSILSQSYDNWEVVILDDYSTDRSFDQIKEIIGDDKRFRCYQNDRNRGVGFTKGRLIELSEGEICGFVDPDDAIGSMALKNAITIFCDRKDVVLSYSGFILCDANLNPKKAFCSTMQVPNGQRHFFNFPVQIAHFASFRKETYDRGLKINPSLHIAEDQDLYLKLYECGTVYCLGTNDYFYRCHEGGISQGRNKERTRYYQGLVIWETMKRRNIKRINGKRVPFCYNAPEEIFSLLEYQNGLMYRIWKRILLLYQNIAI